MIRMTKIKLDEVDVLVLLHFLSPLALGAIQLDCEALKRGNILLGRLKPQPTQRGFPADCAADGIHSLRACEEARGIRVRFGSRFRRVV